MKADLDARIIAALQRNGRATYRELAEEVGAPRAAVSARVQELIESGVIEVVAVARPELLGINAMAHVSITVADEVEPVARAICASPSAVYVSAVTGSYHLLAELRVQTDRDLYDEIAEIRALPGVLSVSTLYYSDVLRGCSCRRGRSVLRCPWMTPT
ncbi:Lrp/AsnC family transcriptional regulator [Prescottella defluvii]|nr:Lrp/AsnC family transcriptional regulator [Prescottella defluvii]